MSFMENRPAGKETKPQALSPKRPNLVRPPVRPVASAPVASAPAAVEPESKAATPEPAITLPQPISPPSEPRQYRAIGLVRGTYQPVEDQFNRGNLVTDEGLEIDSVLLGRVTSLVKNHINLEKPHLWVVYPRTRQNEETREVDLHLQIVGVWEPETLGLPGETPDVEGSASDTVDLDAPKEEVPTRAPSTATVAVPDPQENYFSIRGEIIKYEEDDGEVVVKILQGSKQEGKGSKTFRLNVSGQLSNPRTVGYFWEFDVERQGKALVMRQGNLIGIVPPKKRLPAGKGKRSFPAGARRNSSVEAPKGKPRTRPTAPVKSNPL
ncbi:hypothetical protein [Leptolyngbya sp. PCC 6406]|uniref:hypothetical protein n=1 Tax=Leptolyngbya sp. PCC 6406 TaxID=1173264 RepID=UPI0002AC3FCB|nr:hypothetical protein [Leptolyngbya sp. PCC 6406]